MTISFVTPIVDPLGPEGEVAYSLARSVEPFTAVVIGYDTVVLTWTTPAADTWSGLRVVRSRSGFPRTYDDGKTIVLYEQSNWFEQASTTEVAGLFGGWHYFSIFLKNAFGNWIKVSDVDALVPYDFSSTDRMWDTIPEYYKVIRDDTADLSLVNLRINADLYDNVAGGSVPNELLSAFVSLFGWGFDALRTQVDYLKQGYDPIVIHPSRLHLLAQQFGHEPEVAVPAHVNRTIVRNLASLYRSRGTLTGIKDIVTAVTGWESDVYLGYNRALSDAQSAFVNPSWPEWDPTVRYPAGTLVKRGNWLYLSLDVNLGYAQAPPTTATSDARWQYSDAPVFYPPINGDVGPWQVRMDGVADSGYIAGYTRVASGVPDPDDESKLQYNALMIFRDDTSGTNGATWVDVFSVPGIGSGDSDKERVVKYGIPIPQGSAWQEGRTYRRGEVVKTDTTYWEAVVDHVAETPPEVGSTLWRNTVANDINKGVPLNLSFLSHGPFVTGTNGRSVRPRIRTYDGNGVLLDDLSGTAVNNSSGSTPWVAYDFHFQPNADAKFLAIGARVESMQQVTTSQPLTSYAHFFTNFQLEVSMSTHVARDYQPPRQVQIVMEPDRTNLYAYPSFEAAGTTSHVESNLLVNPSAEAPLGWSSNNGTIWTVTRDTAVKHSGTQSAKSTLNAGQTSAAILSMYGVGSTSSTGATAGIAVGQVYSASAWFMTPASGYRARLFLQFLDASLNIIGGTNYGAYVNLTPSVWARAFVFNLSAPAGTTSIRIGADVLTVSGGNATPGDVAYIDDAVLANAWGHGDYFDGSTPAADEFTYSWDGAAHDSVSRRSAVNPLGVGAGAAYPIYSSDWASSGTKSVRVYSKYHGAGSAYLEFGPNVEWGKTYTISMKVRIREALAVKPKLIANTIGNTPAYSASAELAGTDPGVYDISLTFTFPEQSTGGAKYVRFLNNNANGASVWVDDVLLEETNIEGKYFDGSSGDDYLWRVGGTAHATKSAYYENRLDRTEAIQRALRDAVPLDLSVAEPLFAYNL